MSERPILFSGPMVRALLAGTKTQTRRIVLSGEDIQRGPWVRVRQPSEEHGWQVGSGVYNAWRSIRVGHAAGDILYVREAWRVGKTYDGTKPSELTPRRMTVIFEAGGSIANQESGRWESSRWPEYGADRQTWIGRLRPGMHMPKWASRISLKVSAVRVERLQDISEGDARAEGWPGKPTLARPTPQHWYFGLWNSLHGDHAAAANPWVSVTTFERLP